MNFPLEYTFYVTSSYEFLYYLFAGSIIQIKVGVNIENLYYDAFISYRHVEPDKTIAEKLHKQLESYVIPSKLVKKVGFRKLTRIFRDKEELPLVSNLSDAIQNALASSKFLIVICSSKTKESVWVRKEITLFKQQHGAGRILTLLIDGEPKDSFPEELRFHERDDGTVEEIEPLAADIRASTLSSALRLLKTEKLRVLAPLFSCTFDELKQRHREAFIRKIVYLASGITLFALLFGSFTLWQSSQIQTANVLIEQKNNELTTQISETKKQRDNALFNQSLYLADLSAEQLKKDDVMLARLLALEALPKDLKEPERPYVYEAEAALRNASFYRQSGYFKPSTNLFAESVAFSHDSRLIAAVDNETKTFGIWDAVTLERLNTLQCTTGDAQSNNPHPSFSHKGDRIATISINGDLFVWDVKTGEQTGFLHLDNDKFKSVEFSPDDKTILTTNMDYTTCTAKVWDSASLKLLFTLDNSLRAAFSPDGLHIASTSLQDAKLFLWDVTKKCKIKTYYFKGYGVYDAAFSPDGKEIAVGCPQCWVTLDADFSEQQDDIIVDPTLLTRWCPTDDTCGNITYSPDGRFLATAWTEVTVWSLQKQTNLFIQRFPDYGDIVFSPDGTKMVITSDDFLEGYEKIRSTIFDIIERPEQTEDTYIFDLAKFVDENEDYRAGDILCYNKNILVSTFQRYEAEPNKTYVWNIKTGKRPALELGLSSACVAADISSDGTRIITVSEEGAAQVWDSETGSKLLEYRHELLDKKANIKFCKRGSRAVIIYNTAFVLIDTESGKEVFSGNIEGLSESILEVNWDESKIAVLAGDSFIILDADTGKQLYAIDTFGYAKAIQFDSKGSYIATTNNDSYVYIWNEAYGSLVNTIDNAITDSEFVTFSPDNNKILIGSYSPPYSVTIRDILTGREIATITDDNLWKLDAFFSEDCTRVITVTLNYDCSVYEFNTLEAEMANARDSLNGRQLTEEERTDFFISK